MMNEDISRRMYGRLTMDSREIALALERVTLLSERLSEQVAALNEAYALLRHHLEDVAPQSAVREPTPAEDEA